MELYQVYGRIARTSKYSRRLSGTLSASNRLSLLRCITIPQSREHATRVQYLTRIPELIHLFHHDVESLLYNGLQSSHIRHTEIRLEGRATLAVFLMMNRREDT